MHFCRAKGGSGLCRQMVNKYLTAASSSTGLPLWCVCRVSGLNYTGVVSALQCPVLRPLRGRAAVIGFSMKDHQQLPGGLVDCSAALLHQSSVSRI